jgi:hypothetical protein
MREWDRHKLALRHPPSDRMRDVHKLHITQSVPVLDENSALRHNMPQRDDDEGGNPQRLSFLPAASVWGQMGRTWTSGDRNARTTELVTPSDYVAFFHQYFGITNNPALAPFANVPCGCQRYFMGGEGAWDHPLPPACTASLCVFFFYRPTARPRRTSLPLDCHRNKSDRTMRSGSNARHLMMMPFNCSYRNKNEYMGLKSKVGLVAAKASALRINLNIQGCSVLAPPLHAPSRAPLLLPLLLSHNIPLPRVH